MSGTRIGIVGAGPMGRLHAKTVTRRARSDEDCELVAIVDHHPGRADALVDEFGGTASSELAALESGVDAVIVCVPTSAHLAVAGTLLEHDLDLLVEKPLALSVEEAERLAALARNRDGILQVGHVEWYNPAWREAAHSTGRPRVIEVDRLNPSGPRGLELDVVQDLMIHDLDWVVRWLSAESDQGDEIVELEARGRCVVNDKLDEAEVHLRFRSGCRVRLRASRVHAQRRRCVRIEGSAGTQTRDMATPEMATRSATGESVPDALEHQWAHFLDCVKNRKQPETDGSVGVNALHLVDRVRVSIALGHGESKREDDPALGR